MSKILICIPSYDGKIDLLNLNVMLNHITKDNCVASYQFILGDSLVNRARNKLVATFLKSNLDYLLFIDSDIIYTHNDVQRLYDKAVETKAGVICGVYLKKKLPFEAVCSPKIADTDFENVIEVKEAGTGFMMIRRDVLVDIITRYDLEYKPDNDEDYEKLYNVFHADVVDGRYLSEDYYFCHLARSVGHKIYLVKDLIVGHKGSTIYPQSDEEIIDTTVTLLQSKKLPKPLKDKLKQNL